ncbi:MAG: hypothetical protein J5833_00790 [Victivallales bacterium]|nr:hypothetical protein [Victivallales bacterium]
MRTKRDNDRQSIIRRALMDWLCDQKKDAPCCIGTDVEAPSAKKRFDVVAVSMKRLPRSASKRVNYKGLFTTSAFICCASRKECWPDCADADEIAAEISRLHKERERIEGEIREKEPELKDTSVLFEELAEWEYEKSCNPEYKGIQKNIAWLENILYLGNRIESLAASPMADRFYIVVPENVLNPLELHEGWGLIWVADDGTVTVKREAKQMDAPENLRLALVKQAMEASMRSVVLSATRKSIKARRKISKIDN